MISAQFQPPPFSSLTREAARACLDVIDEMQQRYPRNALSPLREIQAIADSLGSLGPLSKKITIVRATLRQHDSQNECLNTTSEHSLRTAWPQWFQRGRHAFEKPLLYLFGSETLDALQMVSFESAGRGILCNDAETRQSVWSKGVQPTLPLWLASHPDCTPYDPASAREARLILRSALQTLYVNHEAGFYYLATHDDADVDTGPLGNEDMDAVIRGMYRPQLTPDADTIRREKTAPDIRLCGAGKALRSVLDAAHLLSREWGVNSEVWSCPSYTRLARDGRAALRWNMLHPDSPPQRSHIVRCLGDCRAPVIAITGYSRHIAEQIAPFAPARFIALGAMPRREAPGADLPSAQWITVIALKALVDDGLLPAHTLESALQAYAFK